MKAILAILLLVSTASYAQSNPVQPSIVESLFHTGYLPNGFDTNDYVQIVGEGTYSNTCFRPAAYDIRVDHPAKKVFVTPKAYKYDGMCLMMMVPYSQVINLGMLKAGNYQVVQQGETNYSMGNIAIRVAANSSADDFLYAPINQAYWQHGSNVSKITLTGEFSNTCWKYVETRVDVQKNVIVVQPVSEMREGMPCINKVVPFKKEFLMPNLPKGRYLLHVRSTNAKSVNNLVDVY